MSKAGKVFASIIFSVGCLPGIPNVEAAILQPDHVVVVVEQDRASNVLGTSVVPYLNRIAADALVYTNSHGVTHPSLPNTLALFSGRTDELGIEHDPLGDGSNSRSYSSNAPNLAKSLLDAGFTFEGYSEGLPEDGSQVEEASGWAFGKKYDDYYTRNINPMAMFTDLGMDEHGQPRSNSAINRTFDAFQSIGADNDYSDLPTVSFVIPSNLNNFHGSNEAWPWAGSDDEEDNDILRGRADSWLEDNIDGYLQWAKQNNSLLIITQDEERWTGGDADTVTTLIAGDPGLFHAGFNDDDFNHFNLLRTITEMYCLDPLGETGAYTSFSLTNKGMLTVPEPGAGLALVGAAMLLGRRTRRLGREGMQS